MNFDSTMWQMIVQQYLLPALVITACIPAFGFVMGILIRFLYGIVAGILGGGPAYFIFNRLTFIGVVHHELSHALLAFVTGAKVKKIVFFHPEGDKLGYVEYAPRGNFVMRAIQQTMTSIAPVFCGAITTVILYVLLTTMTLPVWGLALMVYAMFSVVVHMTMSGQDFKVMWKGIFVVYLLVLLGVALYHLR